MIHQVFYYFRKIRFGRMWFSLDGAVGKSYGSTFQLIGNQIKQVKSDQKSTVSAGRYIILDL